MIWYVVIYLSIATVLTVWFAFWVLPAISRWLVLPPDDPRPEADDYPEHTLLHDTTKLYAAVYDLRLAINGEMTRLADWLVKHLPKGKP